MSPKRIWSESAGHKGPFFTVTVCAMQVGRGSRVDGKERQQYRRVIGSVCRKCLPASLIKVRGAKLMGRKSRKTTAGRAAVSRNEITSPAVVIA
jgi:hypothetical protein